MVAFPISSNTDAKRAKASEILDLPFAQLNSLGKSDWAKNFNESPKVFGLFTTLEKSLPATTFKIPVKHGRLDDK